LKIIFAGTPAFAAKHLEALIDSEHEILAVYTQPDRPSGRGKKMLASPVKQLAAKHHIPVQQPMTLKNTGAQDTLNAFDADLMIVVAYGLILPERVLNLFPRGCINVHASLLPRWRGAAPIQRAIVAGDTKSGVTIMQMDAGLDTGDMLYKVACDILPEDTGETLHDRLLTLGGEALLKTLTLLDQDQITPEKQNGEDSTYAKKLSKAEANIDWSEPADLVTRKIRAFNAWPVAYSYFDTTCVRIWAAEKSNHQHNAAPGTIIEQDKKTLVVACGDASVSITHLQLPGGKMLPIQAVLNGNRLGFAVERCFSHEK
jgi:methionyl-tRNA formyltransferase